MNHDAAIRDQAAERYTLAEMDDAEREAFEEHYFGCVICAADVQALEAIRQGAGELSDAAPAPAPDPRVLPFRRKSLPLILPWTAAASLMMVVGYQNLVHIPRLAARVAPPVEVVQPLEMVQQELNVISETRAAGELQTLRANEPTLVTVEFMHEPQYVSYDCEVLRRADGVLIARGAISADLVKKGSVTFDLRPLPAGNYEVVIEGVRKEGNRTEVIRQPFVVEERSSGFEEAP